MITPAAIALSFALVLFLFRAGPGGIHAIGGEAVYLEGEACTVNATPDRSVYDLRRDFDACAKLHALYLDRLAVLQSSRTSSTATSSTSTTVSSISGSSHLRVR